MDEIFQAALIDQWRNGGGGTHVYILRRPDGSYFHSIEWDYLPYHHKSFESLFDEQYPGCHIDYVGGVASYYSGGPERKRGFSGFVNDWTKEPRYRITEQSYEFDYEEAIEQPTA